MGNYDSGMAKCKKHDLVVDYFSKQKLNKLTCVEEEGGMNGQIFSHYNNSVSHHSNYQSDTECNLSAQTKSRV